MIQWIKETFFTDDDDDVMQQLVNENDRLSRVLVASQAQHAAEVEELREQLDTMRAVVLEIRGQEQTMVFRSALQTLRSMRSTT